MREQNHGKENETKGLGIAAVIAGASGFLVAFGTILDYVHAGSGEQLTKASVWAPQLVLLVAKLAGQALCDCGGVSKIYHWMTISAATMVMTGLLVALGVVWKRRAAL